MKVTKVRFLTEYRIVDSTAQPKPGAVLAVVQTNRAGDTDDITCSLEDYVFQYTTAGSATGSIPAFAVGEQDTLMGGQMLQMWHSAEGGVIHGTVPSRQSIAGLTILAPLPKDVTSFTLTIKHLNFVSETIQRDSAASAAAAK
jgi:hypothetical protein